MRYIMKNKAYYILVVVAFAFHFSPSVLMAQQPQPGAPAPQRYTVRFESQHGEAFSVFLNGELQNRMPQTRVMVSNVSDQTHEVIIVLKRPTEKAAVMSLRPGEPNVLVNINYDRRLDRLYLYTPAHNRGDVEEKLPELQVPKTYAAQKAAEGTAVAADVPHDTVVRYTEEQVDSMVVRLKGQSFDSDRLALAKVIVASAATLTAEQIARLARVIDFSNSQVDFLKYAYSYCVDKENYYRTVDVLTFSSDKKKVLDYIATQQ